MAGLTNFVFGKGRGAKALRLDAKAVRLLEAALTQIGRGPDQSMRDARMERGAIMAGERPVPPMLYGRFKKMMGESGGTTSIDISDEVIASVAPVRATESREKTDVLTEVRGYKVKESADKRPTMSVTRTAAGRGRAMRGRSKEFSVADQIQLKRKEKARVEKGGRIYRDHMPIATGPTMGAAKGEATGNIFAIGKHRGTMYAIEEISGPTPLPLPDQMPATVSGRKRAQAAALTPYRWQARVLSHPWGRMTRGGFSQRSRSAYGGSTSGMEGRFSTGELTTHQFPIYTGKSGWEEAQADVEKAIDRSYEYRVETGNIPPELKKYVQDEIEKVRKGGKTPAFVPRKRSATSGTVRRRAEGRAATARSEGPAKTISGWRVEGIARYRDSSPKHIRLYRDENKTKRYYLTLVYDESRSPSFQAFTSVAKKKASDPEEDFREGEPTDVRATKKSQGMEKDMHAAARWANSSAEGNPKRRSRKNPVRNGMFDDWKERREEAKAMKQAIKAKLSAEAAVSKHGAKETIREEERAEKRLEREKKRASRTSERDRKRAAADKYRAEQVAEHGEQYGTTSYTIGTGLGRMYKGGKAARDRVAKLMPKSEKKKRGVSFGQGRSGDFKKAAGLHMKKFRGSFEKWYASAEDGRPNYKYLLNSYEDLLMANASLATVGVDDGEIDNATVSIRDTLLSYLMCVDPSKAGLVERAPMKSARALSKSTSKKGNPRNPTAEVHQEMGEGFLAESEKLWGSYCKTGSTKTLLDAYRVLELACQEFEYTGDKKRMKQACEGIKAARAEIISNMKKPAKKKVAKKRPAKKKKATKKRAKKATKKRAKK